ncbi:MAG: S9 family peptidase [Gemmatimonadetes bacterium]|nr:S9 family peptidase [Gemmatimonadota bacterium]
MHRTRARRATRLWLPLLVATLAALSATDGAAQAPALEAILSAPFRSDLAVAPAGARAAWIEYREGVRNLWIAEGADFRPRQLTAYTEDDGQALSDLVFSPDGATLLYVRGGGRNRAGEHPNPTSDPEGVRQEVWAIPTAGGAARRVAEASSPSFSPDGARVAFLREGRAYLVPLAGGEEPRQLFQVRGRVGELQWSPDGGRIALVSERKDHTFIGIYDLEGRSIRWISPSVDRDRNPRWSPDGRRLAFYRFFASTLEVGDISFGRYSAPYALMVADAATGQARELWRSPAEDRQGYPSISGVRELHWAAGDRLLFPAELSGWTHMYAIPVGGGTPVDLTPGECIVEDSHLSPDREWLVYNHNCTDLDRRHLARVRVSGGRPEQLSTGQSIDWNPVLTADGRTLLFIRADARLPGTVHRMPVGGGRAEAVSESATSSFPARAMVEPEQVIFTAEDGLRIHSQLFLPPNARRGERRPAMIFIHGGSRRQMLLGWNYGGYYHNTYAYNQHLANQGYVVLSVNYRSGIGYGREFRQPAEYGWQGASEYRDILAAQRYLAARPDVDPARIGLWGGSYGGYLTALGLARDSDLFAAGVDIHGVHDWAKGLQYFGSRLFDFDAQHPGRADSLYALANASSPLVSLAGWRSPVLLIHADDDRNVDFWHTVELARLLREKGDVVVETLVFPDDVHSFLLHRNWVEAFRASDRFLERHLAPRTAARGGR